MAPPAPKQAVTIAISTPNTTVSIGQPVPIHVELKNVSNHEIKVERVVEQGQAELNYKVVVLGAVDRAVPRTTYGNAAENRQVETVSRVLLPLEMGQTLTDGMDLIKLFKMTKPGTYKVRVGRKWPEDKTGKMEWSNTLTLTITN
jgi:hypothetical protein